LGGPRDFAPKLSAPRDFAPPEFLSSKDFLMDSNKSLNLNTASQFAFTSFLIAKDIKNIDIQYIKEYPIIDLADYEIKLVLQLLDPLDLNKLLLFIPPADLKYIYKKITPSEFQSILDSASKKDNGYMLNKIKIKTILYNDTKKGP
jgi:hypothetical protein